MSLTAGYILNLISFNPMEPEIRLSPHPGGSCGWFMSSFRDRNSSVYHPDFLGRHAWIRFNGICNQFEIRDLSSGRLQHEGSGVSTPFLRDGDVIIFIGRGYRVTRYLVRVQNPGETEDIAIANRNPFSRGYTLLRTTRTGCFYKTLKPAKEGEELKVLLVRAELNALGAAIQSLRAVESCLRNRNACPVLPDVAETCTQGHFTHYAMNTYNFITLHIFQQTRQLSGRRTKVLVLKLIRMLQAIHLAGLEGVNLSPMNIILTSGDHNPRLMDVSELVSFAGGEHDRRQLGLLVFVLLTNVPCYDNYGDLDGSQDVVNLNFSNLAAWGDQAVDFITRLGLGSESEGCLLLSEASKHPWFGGLVNDLAQ